MRKIKKPVSKTNSQKYMKKDFLVYPLYPVEEDIYVQSEKVNSIGNDFGEDTPEDNDDLDVPGAELDDVQENIGSEDEENNYYSIGGDNHIDLEESHPDNKEE